MHTHHSIENTEFEWSCWNVMCKKQFISHYYWILTISTVNESKNHVKISTLHFALGSDRVFSPPQRSRDSQDKSVIVFFLRSFFGGVSSTVWIHHEPSNHRIWTIAIPKSTTIRTHTHSQTHSNRMKKKNCYRPVVNFFLLSSELLLLRLPFA